MFNLFCLFHTFYKNHKLTFLHYLTCFRYRFPLATPLGQMLQGPPRVVSLIESGMHCVMFICTVQDILLRLKYFFQCVTNFSLHQPSLKKYFKIYFSF